MTRKLIKVRQEFETERLPDVGTAVDEELQQSGIKIEHGARIAIAVGSRGITDLGLAIKRVIEFVRRGGGSPFIVPAMGSHGGATAEGQREVLASLGISEERMGIPVLSSMDVVEFSLGGLKQRVFMDRHAYEADGVILINRIKPHTDFHGQYESGLVKMCVIGLGKHKQALEIHRCGVEGLKELTPATAQQIFSTGKIVMGLAIVENARDETALVRALGPDDIMREEPGLLEYARRSMPCLPIEEIDILIIDRQGKDISGTGIDPNITGRIKIRGQEEPEKPRIKEIVVTDLTPASHGNAVGVGFADVITRRFFEKIDLAAMYENVVTSTFLERAKIPMIADNARHALEIASRAAGSLQPREERIIRIRDTLHLEEMYVSGAVLRECQEKLEVIGNFQTIFDDEGELREF